MSTPVFPTIPNAVLTSAFGWRTHPITGVQSFHYGVDLAPPIPGTTGVPIYATQDGVVRQRGYHVNMGNYLYIEHTGDEYTSHYLHLASFNVSVNDVVAKGDVIGIMGTTGASTGVHLDFGVSTSYPAVWYPAPGSYIDPLVYLDQAVDPPDPDYPPIYPGENKVRRQSYTVHRNNPVNRRRR